MDVVVHNAAAQASANFASFTHYADSAAGGACQLVTLLLACISKSLTTSRKTFPLRQHCVNSKCHRIKKFKDD